MLLTLYPRRRIGGNSDSQMFLTGIHYSCSTVVFSPVPGKQIRSFTEKTNALNELPFWTVSLSIFITTRDQKRGNLDHSLFSSRRISSFVAICRIRSKRKKKKKRKNDFTFSGIEDLSFPFIINEDVHPERDFL